MNFCCHVRGGCGVNGSVPGQVKLPDTETELGEVLSIQVNQAFLIDASE